MEPADADAYFGTVLRDAAKGTRLARSQALRTYFLFLCRKVALGDCGRAYGTPCAHENACLRCPLLRPDPAEKPRLAEIILNLAVRIEEAQDRGQLGEAEGRKADLAAAKDKLAQMDYIAASRRATVDLGMPAFSQAARADHHCQLKP